MSISALNSAMPISFVTFYMDVTERTMASIHETTSTITVTEPHQYIQTMFASARHFHPACHQVILSDRDTRFPHHPDTEIIRLRPRPAAADAIALHRLAELPARHQRAYHLSR